MANNVWGPELYLGVDEGNHKYGGQGSVCLFVCFLPSRDDELPSPDRLTSLDLPLSSQEEYGRSSAACSGGIDGKAKMNQRLLQMGPLQ